METEDLLRELESLVEAMEQTLTMITGTIAETTDPKRTLQHLLAAKGAAENTHGTNPWRDRLLRDSIRIVALKARPQAANDPALQTLIASVLEAPVGRDQKH